MANSILINVTGDEIRVALVEGGQVTEFYVEHKSDASQVGNIYKGKVVKVLPGMQSAFVDIGLDKAAFLYVGDIRTDIVGDLASIFDDDRANGLDVEPMKRRQEYLIDELLVEGQELMVQVSKDPLGTKGARITSYVTIPGRYLVFMPGVNHVGISRRIENEDERTRLREIVERIKPEDTGLIIRTFSEGADEEELRRDLEFLSQVWKNIEKRDEHSSASSLLYSDLDITLRSIRDLMGQDVDRLVIDSRDELEKVRDFLNTYFPKLISKTELYDGIEPIFESYGIEHDIQRAMGRKVWLKSGGSIVLDQTEAMTIIDVNTGKYVGKEDLEETILKTNLEAVKEVAYQVRLRNLGGIIIIDFIDMERLENREKVFNAFDEAMSRDRVKSTISHISELGVVQMARKRVRESLGRTLCETCPYCEGKGFVKSPRTLCYEIFRNVERIARHGGKKVVITAHPGVAELLTYDEHQGIEDIETRHGIKVIVAEDPNLHQENYEVTSI